MKSLVFRFSLILLLSMQTLHFCQSGCKKMLVISLPVLFLASQLGRIPLPSAFPLRTLVWSLQMALIKQCLMGWTFVWVLFPQSVGTPCGHSTCPFGVLEVEGNRGNLLAQLPDVTYEEAKAHIELIDSGTITSLTWAGFCAEDAFVWDMVKSREVLRSHCQSGYRFEPYTLDFKRKVRKIS